MRIYDILKFENNLEIMANLIRKKDIIKSYILNNVINIKNYYYADAKIKKFSFLGMHLYVFCGVMSIKTLWEEVFLKYFKSNNLENKIKNLKKHIQDEISLEYIDKFIELIPYWNKFTKKDIQGWTNYDLMLMDKYKQENYIPPFRYITKFNPFIFQNKYGLIDLPQDVFNQINGKDIIDAGGLNGDTAIMFAENFPKSKIYIYEPLIENIKTINILIKEGNFENKIIPIQKGLGNKRGIADFKFNFENQAEIVPLDDDYKGNNLGLIKMDTEGFETAITEGAKNLITKFKPVLAIAMYHTPEDFFELKDKLLELNPEYKFIIRRSEQVIPTADLVLIAY